MSEWKQTSIKDFGRIITGFTPATNDISLWKGVIPFYSPADFDEHIFCSTTERKVSKEAISNDRVVEENSLMVTCIASIGKLALAKERGISNQQINTILFNKYFDPLYCYYLFKYNLNELHKLAGTTAVPIVNKAEFEKIRLRHHAHKVDQEFIGQVLFKADKVIEKTRAAIEKYKAIKQGMLHDLFTRGIDVSSGKLRPSYKDAPELYKETKLGWVPREWEVERLGTNLEHIEQGWSPNCDSVPSTFNEWGILKTTAVTWDLGFDENENKKMPDLYIPKEHYEVKPGDVLVTRAGPNSRVGVVAYVEKTRSKLIFSDKIYRVNPKKKIIPKFLALALSTPATQAHLSNFKTGLAESQTNISQKIVEALFIVIPSVKEQEAIIKALNSCMSKISCEEIYLHKLYQMNQGLMGDLLSGKKRVGVEA